jgi:hypothetical protein
VAIAAAAKPIAILRIMVLTPSSEHPSLWESNRTVPIELQHAAQSLSVRASEAELEFSVALMAKPKRASAA